jgi:hypothetical protein
MSEPTGEQPSVTPTVSTAPAQSRWSKLPSHLGRARTSTLVLALLFLAIGALYLNIRPPTPGTVATTSGTDTGTGVQQPAEVPATESAPETTAEPTTSVPETTSAPTSTSEQTATETPTRTTTPEPTSTAVPTITSPSRAPSSPTTVIPTG